MTLGSAAVATRSADCWSGVMAACGRTSDPTTKPSTIAAIVVAQKNESVRTTSRPTVRRSPSLAIPAKSAVATSGITTIDRRFKNSEPTGRRSCTALASAGWPSFDRLAATRPSNRPAPKPSPIHTWLLIGCRLLYRHARTHTRADEVPEMGADPGRVERLRRRGGPGAGAGGL